MNRFEQALREFQEAFGMVTLGHPVSRHDPDLRKLRENLIEEEFKELKEALDNEDINEICKEGIDLLYVVLGLLVTYGVPVTECFEEVQRSNMSKLDENGRAIYREDGKVLKGPNYSPANLKPIIEKYMTLR